MSNFYNHLNEIIVMITHITLGDQENVSCLTCLFDLILYIPSAIFSGKQGWVFLG